MGIKSINYFQQNTSTNETIKILDCGYHETDQGRYSKQTVIDHYVLHCIKSGKGNYQINGNTYHLEANDCFLLLPNVSILYQSDITDPWVYYWIGFDGVDVTQLMQLCNITMSKPILHYENIQEITDLIAPLVTLNSGILSESYVALSQFYLICSKLMQHNHNIKPLSRKEYYVNQAISQIQNSYYKNITVQSIADSIGLDRTYLFRIFKEISGIPMQQYIANLRLKRACYFLTDTTMSYNEISYYCGYNSEQYFSMMFKKNMSMTPSAYRKNPPHKS